jgi:hypothetical protein
MGQALGRDRNVGNAVEEVGRNFRDEPADQRFEVGEAHANNESVNGEQ